MHSSFASRTLPPYIALTISTISRGGVKINISCYMIKLVFFDLDPLLINGSRALCECMNFNDFKRSKKCGICIKNCVSPNCYKAAESHSKSSRQCTGPGQSPKSIFWLPVKLKSSRIGVFSPNLATVPSASKCGLPQQPVQLEVCWLGPPLIHNSTRRAAIDQFKFRLMEFIIFPSGSLKYTVNKWFCRV